jgi:hypothetical protein
MSGHRDCWPDDVAAGDVCSGVEVVYVRFPEAEPARRIDVLDVLSRQFEVQGLEVVLEVTGCGG